MCSAPPNWEYHIIMLFAAPSVLESCNRPGHDLVVAAWCRYTPLSHCPRLSLKFTHHITKEITWPRILQRDAMPLRYSSFVCMGRTNVFLGSDRLFGLVCTRHILKRAFAHAYGSIRLPPPSGHPWEATINFGLIICEDIYKPPFRGPKLRFCITTSLLNIEIIVIRIYVLSQKLTTPMTWLVHRNPSLCVLCLSSTNSILQNETRD